MFSLFISLFHFNIKHFHFLHDSYKTFTLREFLSFFSLCLLKRKDTLWNFSFRVFDEETGIFSNKRSNNFVHISTSTSYLPVSHLQTLKTNPETHLWLQKNNLTLQKNNLTRRPFFRSASWNLLIGSKHQRRRATGNLFLRHKQKALNRLLTKKNIL